MAMIVGQNLHLDMSRAIEIALDVDGAVTEGRLCLGLRYWEHLQQLSSSQATRIPRPPPPATALISTG